MNLLTDFFSKGWAFQKRDFRDRVSYSYSLVFDALEIFASLLVFFFISRLVSEGGLPSLASYGGNYFAFVLIGIAFSGFQEAALYGYSNTINSEQGNGTLEAILVTPTSLGAVMGIGIFWRFLFVTLRSFLYLAAGIIIFQARISLLSPAALLILALSFTAMSGFGLISAGFIMIYKQGDPVSFFFNSASKFISGLYFPVTVLPVWIQPLSYFFPLTYTLSALRKSLLKGSGIAQAAPECLVLILFSAIFLPVGIFYFRYASRRARREGSLILT